MGAFPNFPEQEDQQQQPPEPPLPPPERAQLPEAQPQSSQVSEHTDSEDEFHPLVILPPNTLDCQDNRSIAQYNHGRGLTLQQCLDEISTFMGPDCVYPDQTAFWYDFFEEDEEPPLILKESRTRERSPSLSPPHLGPRRRIGDQQPSTSAQAAQLEQQGQQQPQQQQEQQQQQQQQRSSCLQEQQQQQQELRMLQGNQQNQQQRQQQGDRPPEMQQEPSQVEEVEVKIEPPGQDGQEQFPDWEQKFKPDLLQRIDNLVKSEAFITVEEAARRIGISEDEFVKIATELLHMRRTSNVWLSFDPASENNEIDLPVSSFVVEEKIEIGEEFKIKIPPITESTTSAAIVTGEPREANTSEPVLRHTLKRERSSEAIAEASSSSGLTNRNSSIESSNNGNENNQNNNNNNNRNNNNHEDSNDDGMQDNPQPSTSFSPPESNRTSKPNELSFKGAISDQEPIEKEPTSESDNSDMPFFKRTVRRATNTIKKSKTPRKREAGLHSCKYCKRFFKYKYHATRHMNYHCPQRDSADKTRVKCEQCEQTFTSNNCKQRHLFFVHQKMRNAVTCKRCKRMFIDEEKLEKHRRRNTCRGGHLKDAVCDKCHKRYRDLNSLRRHRELECDKERPYGCAHCDYRTHQKVNIIRHFERKHSEVEMKSSCPRCSRVYKNECSLKRHLQYECGKEPAFACDLCKYKTKRKFCLMNHMRSQHSKKRRV